MKKKWEPKSIELIPVIITTEEFDQLLEEYAEILYVELRQLSQRQNLCSAPTNNQVEGRTGTNG